MIEGEIDYIREILTEKNWEKITEYYEDAKNLRDQWFSNYRNP